MDFTVDLFKFKVSTAPTDPAYLEGNTLRTLQEVHLSGSTRSITGAIGNVVIMEQIIPYPYLMELRPRHG